MDARKLLAPLAALAISVACAPDATAHAAAGSVEERRFGPGPAEPDEFHPDRWTRPDGSRPPLPEPAFGGRAIVHLEAMPTTLCYTIDNTAFTRRIQYELNETLLLQDWERHDLRPNLAERFDVEDTLVLGDDRGEGDSNCVFGRAVDDGDCWRVGDRRIPKLDVKRFERGTVLTFDLRDGVKWHDGHPFDARDVWFSWSVYLNPSVQCGEKRHQFQRVVRAEILDPHTVRFFYDEPYGLALQSLGDMFILPAHLYDLTHSDNADGKAKRATDATWTPSEKEQAEYVNKNTHNRDWIGLGPYRLVKWDADMIEAARFDDYFDPQRGGYLDTIRWRFIQKDAVAFQALLAGELDFYARLTSDEYFGDATEKALFTDRFYKGYFYSTAYWYVGWNLKRPQFSDVRVRRALAHLFDFDEYKRTFYKGVAVQVTGPFSLYSKGYNHDVKPYPCDPAAAEALLAEAGWYDRDGDGVLDKDGQPLEIQLLMRAGDPVGAQFGLRYQESLARAGIRLAIMELEWAALLDRRRTRDFDAIVLGWAPPLETDPGQVWSSSHASKPDSSNYVGFVDETVDRLIEENQRELDADRRAALQREIHARVYDLQPYLFAYNPPRKFAMSKAIRGFQAVHIDPNYVVRRWYYPAGTPGTRATRERGE
jgi:peptide/nickel transport system substrate-binding protein